jgi:nucleoid-associated protein EbfC
MNIDEIMKMAANVQDQMARAQADLEKIEVEGSAGGGMVTVRATAKGRILKLDIAPELLTPADKDMCEDLVVAALNDARAKADAAGHAEMQRMTAGMNLPAGFTLPG